MEQSKRWRVNKADFLRVGKNALIFLAPLFVVALGALEAGKTTEEIKYLVYMWVLGVALDFFRKLSAGEPK